MTGIMVANMLAFNKKIDLEQFDQQLCGRYYITIRSISSNTHRPNSKFRNITAFIC